MATRMSKGFADWYSLKNEAEWYDLLTSEGSLSLAIGERQAADTNQFGRAAEICPTGKMQRIATIQNESGRYTLEIQANHRGDVYSGGGWHTWWITRVA